jgi:hypothetical protein
MSQAAERFGVAQNIIEPRRRKEKGEGGEGVEGGEITPNS